MVEPAPSKKEIVYLVEAQAKSIDSISERFTRIENLVNSQESRNDKQENRNRDVMIAVLVAFVLIVGSVAVSVIISNRKDNQFYSGLEKDVYNQNLKLQDLNNKVDNLKIRNPYLK